MIHIIAYNEIEMYIGQKKQNGVVNARTRFARNTQQNVPRDVDDLFSLLGKAFLFRPTAVFILLLVYIS